MAHKFTNESGTFILCEDCGTWCKLGETCKCPVEGYDFKKLERDSVNPESAQR